MNPQMNYNDYINMLSLGVIKPLLKVEFLRHEDESVQSSIIKIPLDSSSLTCDCSNGVRRAVSLVLDNNAKDFIPSIDSLWMGFKFQLYLGYRDNQDREIWFPQGIFCIFDSEPNQISNYSEKTVTISASDKMSLLNIPIGHLYIIPSGHLVVDEIRSILTLVGDKKEPIIQDLPDINPYDLRWSADTTYLTVLRDLANLYCRDCFYDTTGHFVFTEFVEENTSESIFDFTTTNCAYMGATRILKYSQVFYHVYVVGASMENGTTFEGEAKNDDLTSNTRIDLVGDKPMPVINDSKIISNTSCNERANMELTKAKRIQENISINCLALFHADVNKAITVTDDSIRLHHARFIIQQFQMPLNAKSEMTITGFKYNNDIDFLDRLSENTQS